MEHIEKEGGNFRNEVAKEGKAEKTVNIAHIIGRI